MTGIKTVIKIARKPRTEVRKLYRRYLTAQAVARPYQLVCDDGRELHGQTAVVTGASGAIGRAISIRLAANGATVCLLGRNKAALLAVETEIRDLGGSAESVVCDIGDVDSFELLCERIVRQHNAFNILVNCAGGSARGGAKALWEQSPDVIDELLKVNLMAPIHTMRLASRYMVAQRQGVIINIGSIISRQGKASYSDYAAAKAGLVGLTRSSAIELGPFGVRVNCISPGIVPRGAVSGADAERIGKTSVLGQLGRPEDISELASFLVSDRARFITGQDYLVDGGRSLGLRGD